jgi:hypothetical protein
MKKLTFILFLISSFISNAQSSKWSMLFNTGFNHGASNRLRVQNELENHLGLFDQNNLRSLSFYTFNPGVRFSTQKFALELGIRNLGLANNGSLRGEPRESGNIDLIINTNMGVYLGALKTLLSYKEVIEFKIGADMFYNYSLVGTFKIVHDENSNYEEESRLTINEVGLNVTPNLAFNLSQKFSLEISSPINIVGWGNALAIETIREDRDLVDYANQRFSKYDFSNTYGIQLSLIINL